MPTSRRGPVMAGARMGKFPRECLCGAAKPDPGRKVDPMTNELSGKKILFWPPMRA